MLVKPTDFFSAVSQRPGLKLSLAMLSLVCVAVPAAVLMSFGVSEKYVLPAILVVILPFEYIAFCVIEALKRTQVGVNYQVIVTTRGGLVIVAPTLVKDNPVWSFSDFVGASAGRNLVHYHSREASMRSSFDKAIPISGSGVSGLIIHGTT